MTAVLSYEPDTACLIWCVLTQMWTEMLHFICLHNGMSQLNIVCDSANLTHSGTSYKFCLVFKYTTIPRIFIVCCFLGVFFPSWIPQDPWLIGYNQHWLRNRTTTLTHNSCAMWPLSTFGFGQVAFNIWCSYITTSKTYCSCIYCTDTLTYSMFSCSHALQNWGNENVCMYEKNCALVVKIKFI